MRTTEPSLRQEPYLELDDCAPESAAQSGRSGRIRVTTFGLPGTFQRVLEIVFRHARYNRHEFVLTQASGPGDYDLALVDMTAHGGAAVAETLRRLPDRGPILTVGRRCDVTRVQDDLLLQRFGLNLLEVLNTAVDRHLIGPAQQGAVAVRRMAASWGAPPAAQSLLGRQPRALVVDPSSSVRRQLLVALQQLGVDSDGVAEAREAMNRLALQHYELMITEVQLPDLDGLTLVRRLKRSRRFRAMPIIVLSRRNRVFDVIRGAWARCDHFLVKPLVLNTLREAVECSVRKALHTVVRERAAGADVARFPAADVGRR